LAGLCQDLLGELIAPPDPSWSKEWGRATEEEAAKGRKGGRMEGIGKRRGRERNIASS